MAKKLVHWALETLGSPSLPSLRLPGNYEEESSTESSEENTTATLQYVNTQLIAHGFTYQPGLSLEGTSKEDAEKVLKCLVAMLGQRMEDMSRTEELSTKIRTLSYDHERLQSMYRTATEQAANAEREMNVHKARLASTTRTLTTTTASLKTSQAELQRTRTALQSVRATHQAELKKLEKEKDKLLEKVAKLSDHQFVTRVAGIRYANENAVTHYGGPTTLGPIPLNASATAPPGQGTGDFLEVTLEESMRHRQELAEENRALKTILMRLANEVQSVEFQARCAAADLLSIKKETQDIEVPEPEVLTSVALFPLSPPIPSTASSIVNTLLTSLRDSLRSLADPEGRITTDEGLTATALTGSRRAMQDTAEANEVNGIASLGKQLGAKDREREQERVRHEAEVKKLAGEICKLESELEQARTQASTYAAQIQLTDLSKQVEAMKRPFAIYGSQPEPVPIAVVQPTPMEVDPAPSQPPPPLQQEPPKQLKRQPAKRPPPSAAASSSKQALDGLFRPQPEPEPEPAVAAPSVHTDDDVFAHLPPPSPALSYVEAPVPRPATLEPAPVRRSPRKPKPTSPLRIGIKAGAKRKASEAASPEEKAKAKKAKVEPPKKDAITTSVRGFNSGVVAASSPKPRTRGKVAEKETKATAKGKGKERAAPLAKASGKAAGKLPSKPFDVEVPPSPKPPALPAFVLPPPSPASRLPSLQITAEAGPSRTQPSGPVEDENPFAEPPQAAAPAPTSTQLAPTNSTQASKPVTTSKTSTANAASAPAEPAVPQTPSKRIFPPNGTGRPLAPHMKHAYSPVKPSPLSRILMLASPDSPEEPPIPKLGAVVEESEDETDVDDDGAAHNPVSPTPVRRSTRLSFAQELAAEDDGMDSDDEMAMSDAEEVEVLIRGKAKGKQRASLVAKATAPARAAKPSTSRAAAEPKGRTRTRSSPRGLPKEKENARKSPRARAKLVQRARTRSGSSAEGEHTKRSTVIGGGIKKTRPSTRAAAAKPGPSKSTTPATVPPLELEELEPAPKGGMKPKGKLRGAPRRVPIDSSEAAPSVPAWRG
ncbi:Afadin and alpha-actinin-binding-domain-containing protein [Phanerochaete sordida]|uniref:Afadin and alpha-actinin-binding-domain-containing protein n=1 Tax=Phanerochaete sordida TaxID=48140 RepID=A0A9P3LFT6_9APHY|nr:Afadin and alpha-actinin-binding-domain-containing protein [Phanerochaete sordida]